MEDSNLQKTFALLDAENVVLNVVCVLASDVDDVLPLIAEQWNAESWVDTEEYGETASGGTFDGERLWIPQPYPSWVKGEDGTWKAPIPYPDSQITHVWDEETTSWVWPPKPFPSWVAGEFGWEPPLPHPILPGYWKWNEEKLAWVPDLAMM